MSVRLYSCLWYPACKSYFNKTRTFSIYFRKIHKYQFSWNIVQWEMSCSMRKDITNLTVTLRYLANAPINCNNSSCTFVLHIIYSYPGHVTWYATTKCTTLKQVTYHLVIRIKTWYKIFFPPLAISRVKIVKSSFLSNVLRFPQVPRFSPFVRILRVTSS